jgi:hypothetical protein
VHDAFVARRRRESESAALFDTAGDLAALRSVDEVLTAILRRARQLLGTGVSYLTLNDDARGGTYMRMTDGSVSARLQSLRRLVRGSLVIRLLFAADRNERRYHRCEVSLLDSPAAHAGIALENFRLLEETRAALEDLSSRPRQGQQRLEQVGRLFGGE